MKKIFTLVVLLVAGLCIQAQVNYRVLFDFEEGNDTTYWISFANGAESARTDIDVVLNPMTDDVNSTDSVLMMDINIDAEGWVGYYTDLDVLYQDFDYPESAVGFDEETYMMSLMVYKTVYSPTRIKLERSLTGAANITVADTNTVVDAWQFLEYDFSSQIGHYFQRLTIFPESTSKSNRTEELVVYLDNIGIQDPSNTSVKEFEGAKMKLYPNPADYRIAVVYPEMTGVRLLNINGQEIRTLNFGLTSSKVVEVGDLATGTYFVTAITSKGDFTMPFVKK